MQFKCSVTPRQYARSFVDFSAFEIRNLTLDKDDLLAKRSERMISGHAFRRDWLKQFLTHPDEGMQNKPVCLSTVN